LAQIYEVRSEKGGSEKQKKQAKSSQKNVYLTFTSNPAKFWQVYSEGQMFFYALILVMKDENCQ
jgi:hypothetical protein